MQDDDTAVVEAHTKNFFGGSKGVLYGFPRAAAATFSSSTSPSRAAPQGSKCVSCVECGMKKKHKVGYLFDLWKTYHDKSEVGASFPSRKRGVSQLEHLRMLFVEHREAIKVRYNMSSS